MSIFFDRAIKATTPASIGLLQGMNACEAVCRQDYSCDGVTIGTHLIGRQFRKGSFNGNNVTIVDVTKQDNPAGPGDFPQRTLPRGQEYASRASEREEIA